MNLHSSIFCERYDGELAAGFALTDIREKMRLDQINLHQAEQARERLITIQADAATDEGLLEPIERELEELDEQLQALRDRIVSLYQEAEEREYADQLGIIYQG